MLRETSTLLNDADKHTLAQALGAALDNSALTKPEGHLGPVATDMFQLSLTHTERVQVLAVVQNASARKAVTSEGRGMGGFVEAWQEYADWSGPD